MHLFGYLLRAFGWVHSLRRLQCVVALLKSRKLSIAASVFLDATAMEVVLLWGATAMYKKRPPRRFVPLPPSSLASVTFLSTLVVYVGVSRCEQASVAEW